MLVVHSDSDVFHIRPFAESFTSKRIQALTEDVFGDAQKAAPVLNAVDWPEQAFALPGQRSMQRFPTKYIRPHFHAGRVPRAAMDAAQPVWNGSIA